MGASENGRMHPTYYKGNSAYSSDYDERYFGGYTCNSPSCSNCKLPDSSSAVTCATHFGGHYQVTDDRVLQGSYYYTYDKLGNPAYQTSTYMAPIGEYYPFASVLLCKRVRAALSLVPFPPPSLDQGIAHACGHWDGCFARRTY